jgi:6,7-dimethyl-8-ribityllumazine synthase
VSELPALRPPDEERPDEEQVEEQPEHAPGRFDVPSGYKVLTGSKGGSGKTVGVVVAKFNGEITSRLLQRALDELEEATIVPVPGAFELPVAAIALAKTRKYACIVALGCVIRGETPHFDYVAGEAASGLQLAAIETGVPVSFGVLTTDSLEQAEARIDRAADAVRGALEMAGLFQHLRAAAR